MLIETIQCDDVALGPGVYGHEHGRGHGHGVQCIMYITTTLILPCILALDYNYLTLDIHCLNITQHTVMPTSYERLILSTV
jgi:hypothetical protein